MNSKPLKIDLNRDSQYLLIEWMRWNEKLNAMPPTKAVYAVRAWTDLIQKSLEIKVWNN